MERRRERACGAAADFETDESGHGKYQEREKESEEVGVDGEDSGGENSGKRKHGEESSIAIGGGAVKTDNRDKKKEVDGGEKGGIENRVGTATRQTAGKKKSVQRK